MSARHIPPPVSLTPGSTVVAYVRDSGGPRQDASTAQQLAEITAFCGKYGLNLSRHYVDEARSGSSIIARDQFVALIDSTRAAENRPAAVLIWNYARFTRDLDDAIYYKALLRKRGIIIHSVTDPVPEGQYGRIVEFLIDVSNEEKRRQTASDARRGLRDLVINHGCVPGIPPRGFMRAPVTLAPHRDNTAHNAARWVPDPQTAPLITRAFSLRAAGATLAQIHAETHLYTGISSYKAMFTNRIYIGILEFGDLTVENYCAPLVDLQTWDTVQEIIQRHSRATHDRLHPRRVSSPYALSGLVFCAECGSPMNANTVSGGQRGRNEAYRCGRSKRRAGCSAGRIGRRSLENAVITTLTEYLFQPDSLAALYEIDQRSIAHRAAHIREKLANIAAEKKKLNTQIANLTRAIADHGHSPALLERLTELEKTRATLTAQADDLNRITQPAADVELTPLQINITSEHLLRILNSGDPQQIALLMRAFVSRIDVLKTPENQLSGTITYYTPPAAEAPGENSCYNSPDDNLPMSALPLGAPLHRQTYSHPIIFPPNKKT